MFKLEVQLLGDLVFIRIKKLNIKIKSWAAAGTRMKKGGKKASTREKFRAIIPELDDYSLESHRSNFNRFLTDTSSLASEVEKPKEKKIIKKRKNLRIRL